MYCPPESGNMEPSSAKATQAHSEITPPSTHARKNKVGFGKGPAISLAVRKMEEPMMPLTSSSTESSKLSPRTRLGFSLDVSASGGRESGWVFISGRWRVSSSHGQFVGRLERRSAAAADDGGAVAAGQRIADFHGADWAVEHHCGLLGV